LRRRTKARRLGRRAACLRSSVDALFEPRSADDLVAIAEAGLRPRLAMLVPERGNSIVELTELGGEDDVVSLGQTVQEIGALLACPLGLGTDFGKCSHRMGKRMTRISHSLLLALALLAGCGGEQKRSELAYSVVREEVPTRIVVVEDDGTDARRVTGARFRANPVLPAWSPDGQRIAFVRFTQTGGPKALQTYVVRADGSGERQLGQGTLPVWTSDGRFVVVERPQTPPQPSTIHVFSSDGRSQRRLTVGSAPAAAHRGSRIAFVRYTYGRRRPDVVTSSSLYTISLDGTGLRLLARTKGREIRWVQPKWLPDDSAVTVAQRTGRVTGSGPLLTFSMNGRRRVIVPKVGETYDWSPNADLLAYTLGDLLSIVRPDGTEVDSFGQSNAIDIEWSPDGTMVAFSIPEVLQTGQFVGLYIIEVDEGKRRRFVITDGSVAFFDWRPEPPSD
jgi:Tol biopolymer transport system component